jgi:hypothetical protein
MNDRCVVAEDAVHIGMFDADRLLAYYVFGYPDANDSYIGLLLLLRHTRAGVGRALAHDNPSARADRPPTGCGTG